MCNKLKGSGGVLGVYFPDENVARNIFYGLFAIQHRGPSSAGIVTSGDTRLHTFSNLGLVSQVFDEKTLALLPGTLGIGEITKTTRIDRADKPRPIVAQNLQTGEQVAVAHNGNLVNSLTLREDLISEGFELNTQTDAEIIAVLLANTTPGTWEERFKAVMKRLVGAYSLCVLTKNQIFAVRDPLGNRPLCIGQIGLGWMISSETCALDHCQATQIREIEPGEVVQIDKMGLTSFFPLGKSDHPAICVFEKISFARPDSLVDNEVTWVTREDLGRTLALEHPVEADLVIGVPDSATPAAIGYAREAGIPYHEGLVKNRYVGHTLVKLNQNLIDLGVGLKFNALTDVLTGKKVVVVDDRIVIGTTTQGVVKLLRRAGATEVHLRITSPPVKHACVYGVDMATKEELIASDKTLEEIRAFIGAKSLGFLSVEGLLRALRTHRGRTCLACFTGRYPTAVQGQLPLEIRRIIPTLELIHF